MFLGEYKTTFSGLGRVILPKKLRLELSGGVIILSRGFERCIFGYDLKTWEEQSQKVLEQPTTEERARYLRRYLFSGSVSVELDSQGRFVIPSALLSYAMVTEEVVIVGAGDHFEIWEAKSWEKQLKGMEVEYGKVS